jgi:hypothetical protein
MSTNGSDHLVETERPCAADIPTICRELQKLQRQRAVLLKFQIMNHNRLRAYVASDLLGYKAQLAEKERKKAFKQAQAMVKKVEAMLKKAKKEGSENLIVDAYPIIASSLAAIGHYKGIKKMIEEGMKELAEKLPVAAWAATVHGFGTTSRLFLAEIIGETGDLSNYANPAKVWRRLGCAPFLFDGKTLMGSTWRYGKEGKLPAEQWQEFGYNPRRRSLAYMIGKVIVFSNKDIYRARYDETKAAMARKHPEYSKLRCDRHGMLLATKMLLRDLWVEWRRRVTS